MKNSSFIAVCLYFIGIQLTWAQTVVKYNNDISTLNGEPFFVRGTYTDNNPEVDFAKVKAAGFNVVMSYYTKSGNPEHVKLVLDNAEANGLYALIYIGNNNIKQAKYDVISSIVNQFKNHPALYGWYLTDEPGPWYANIPLENLQEASKRVKEADNNHPIFGSIWELNNNDAYVTNIDVDMRQGYFGNPKDMIDDYKNGRSGLNSGYINKIEGYNKEWLTIINAHVSPFIEPDKSGAAKAKYASPAMWYSSGGLSDTEGSQRGDDLNAVRSNPFDQKDRFDVEFKKSINFPDSTDRIRGQVSAALVYGSNALWSWLWHDGEMDINTRWGWYTVYHYEPTKNGYATVLAELQQIEHVLASAKQHDKRATISDVTIRYIKSDNDVEVVIAVNETNAIKTVTLPLPSGAGKIYTNLKNDELVNLRNEITIPANSGLIFLVSDEVISSEPPIALCQEVVVNAAADICSTQASINNGSSDPDGDSKSITQSPAGPYPLGTTDVTLTILELTTEQAFSASCSATVTIVDVTAPNIDAGATVNLTADSSDSASYTLAATASDSCGAVTVTYSPEKTVYPLGTTSVTVKATDTSGNISTDTVDIIVKVATVTPEEPKESSGGGFGAFLLLSIGLIAFRKYKY